MNLPKKSSSCTICKRRGYTEWHHIISKGHAIKSRQRELLTNRDNLIELCRRCHNQTTASMVRKRLLRGSGVENFQIIAGGVEKEIKVRINRKNGIQTNLKILPMKIADSTINTLQKCGIWSANLNNDDAEKRLIGYKSHRLKGSRD